MKIQMDVANGYRDTKIAKIKLDNPSWTNEQATAQFVDELYGAYIRDNIGTDFEIVDVTAQNFRIDFTYEDDANAFRRTIGGSIVED